MPRSQDENSREEIVWALPPRLRLTNNLFTYSARDATSFDKLSYKIYHNMKLTNVKNAKWLKIRERCLFTYSHI